MFVTFLVNLGIKTVLYLKFNHINDLVGVLNTCKSGYERLQKSKNS